MAVTKDEVVNLLIMTGISVACAAGGFYGARAIRTGPILKADKQRAELMNQNRDLLVETFTHARANYDLPEKHIPAVLSLERRVAELTAQRETFPKTEAGYKERTRLSREIRRIEREIQDIQHTRAREYIDGIAASDLPEAARQYMENSQVIEEINSRGWKYSRGFAITLYVLNVVATAVMGMGFLGIFAFGICGTITVLGSM
ncbi:MAG: hypothetical protein KC897_00595 [Candidatus Omnitrophica bacterium]|nr:hypothetical protein [Candidatus Omnitrophota bacterium]MCB9719949.1 hypothetical protein [Candidatus Omnitrophota bacterium]